MFVTVKEKRFTNDIRASARLEIIITRYRRLKNKIKKQVHYQKKKNEI